MFAARYILLCYNKISYKLTVTIVVVMKIIVSNDMNIVILIMANLA